MLGFFRRQKLAHASVLSPMQLRLHRTAGKDLDIDLTQATGLGFLRMGESYSTSTLVDEGWWLIILPTHAIAIKEDCPHIDKLLRGSYGTGWPESGTFATLLEPLSNKFILWLLTRPKLLRGHDKADGVAVLDLQELELLLKGRVEPVNSIKAFPAIV